MLDLLTPIIAAALTWWASTGVLIWLVGRERSLHKWIAVAATIGMVAATAAVVALRDADTAIGAYAGFAVGIALWAWHETMFLLGYISGPRRAPCPPNLKMWPRFLVSTQTVIHHEVAIALHAVLILALSIGADNAFAAATFMLLWGMRLNAKLVVFLGAPNISDEFLPPHLTYLSTYFGKRRVTAFFPVFITLATAAATALTYAAAVHAASPFVIIGYVLLATLAWLAVLEHWLLVLPVPDQALWAWAQRKTHQPGKAPSAAPIVGGQNHGL